MGEHCEDFLALRNVIIDWDLTYTGSGGQYRFGIDNALGELEYFDDEDLTQPQQLLFDLFNAATREELKLLVLE